MMDALREGRTLRKFGITRNCPRFKALMDADARHHGGPVELDDQEQGFYRGLPFLEIPARPSAGW